MNRIDRLAAFVIQFQAKKLVKAQDLADKFKISLRTVYRDVKALEEAGVPIIGEAGIGYSLMEGYKLPPVMFSKEEATALLTGAKLVQSRTDAGISKHYLAALDKIKAVLRLAEKDHIEEIEDHIAVVTSPSFVSTPVKELHLQSILRAISMAALVEIRYTSIEKNELTTRRIEPIGIYYMGSYWHLVAFCQLRNDYRNFRTDKILQLVQLEEQIKVKHPPLQSFINKTSAEKKLHKIILDVGVDIVKHLGEQKYYSGFVSEEIIGDHVRMSFLTASLTGFARWFMLFGDHANIVEPLALNDLVAEIAENILKKVESGAMLLT